MYKNLQLNERINLLIVCIETLYAYQHKPLNSGISYHTLWEDLFYIKHHHCIEYKNIYCPADHKNTIQIIKYIYIIIKKLYLREVIIDIIKSSGNKSDSTLEQQYIRRYKYIYQKTKNYYNIKSQTNKSNIEDQAMANLYIINQIYNIKGIYILIKYLYQK